jgi:alkylation response protein AidB-like acyl-CoA dehydrogenase
MTFTDVVVPLANQVDMTPFTGTDAALSLRDDPLGIFASANLLSLAVYSGVAIAARDRFVGFANGRAPANLGAPLSSLPRFQQAAGEIEALLYENRQLIFGLARRIDERVRAYEETGVVPPNVQTNLVGSESSVIKHLVSGNVIRITEIALSMTGNPGLSAGLDLARHHRDALCGRVHTPQSDLIVGGLGRAALQRAARTSDDDVEGIRRGV